MILVDTNVLLDLVTDDPNWSEWSLARLEEAALAGPVLINDVIYAETSIRYERIEDLEKAVIEHRKFSFEPSYIELAVDGLRKAGVPEKTALAEKL